MRFSSAWPTRLKVYRGHTVGANAQDYHVHEITDVFFKLWKRSNLDEMATISHLSLFGYFSSTSISFKTEKRGHS